MNGMKTCMVAAVLGVAVTHATLTADPASGSTEVTDRHAATVTTLLVNGRQIPCTLSPGVPFTFTE